jgi:hypothetical protein
VRLSLPQYNNREAQKMGKKFRFYWISISLGVILSIVSLPPLFLLSMEMMYRTHMNNRYQIGNEYLQMLETDSFDDPYQADLPVPYTFGKNEIDARIVPKKKYSPTIFAGDVDLYLNGKFLGIIWNRVLESDYPVTKEQPASFDLSNTNDVSIYTLKDNDSNQEDIIIFADITAYQIKAGEEYLLNRYYPKNMEEMTQFQYWRIHKDGSYDKEVFRQKSDRTDLQTFLALNSGANVGYFTTWLNAYPAFYFPLPYPLFSGFLGIFLLFHGVVSRKIKRKGLV